MDGSIERDEWSKEQDRWIIEILGGIENILKKHEPKNISFIVLPDMLLAPDAWAVFEWDNTTCEIGLSRKRYDVFKKGRSKFIRHVLRKLREHIYNTHDDAIIIELHDSGQYTFSLDFVKRSFLLEIIKF